MKFFFTIIIGFIIVSGFLALVPDFVSATQTAKEQFESGIKSTAGGMGYGDELPSDSAGFLSGKIGIIIGAMLSFLGVAFLVLMIYGGLTWMMAQGNEQEVGRAKGIIISAIIGLIVILAAYAITAIVGGEMASVVTQ